MDIPQRVAQEIMRHSCPSLTAEVYTDTASLHTWSAIDALPGVAVPLSQGVYQEAVVGGHPVTLAGTTGETGRE